ncbi:MAG: anthranilate synthase component II [Lachnospirales bacterium]
MIVLVDNYDSFTFNLYQYLGEFDKDIRVFRNDKITPCEILELNPDRVVISPGPKTPEEAGNCIDIIKEVGGKIPLLGVCLGHQSIAVAYGGVVSNAKTLCHGKSSMMEHNGEGIFTNCQNPMEVARYHSLSVVEESLPDCLVVTARAEGEIMAIKHKEYDVVGLQFHPESINTPEGMTIIKNFVEGRL